MKVHIVGTHSTGKTTIAKITSMITGTPYKRKKKIKEIAEAEGLPITETEMSEEQKIFLQEELLESILGVQSTNNYVTDSISYMRIPYSSIYSNMRKIKPDDHDELIRRSLIIPTDAKIIYLPPTIPLKPNGARPTDKRERLLIDSWIRSLTMAYEHKVVTGSLINRIEQTLAYIGVRK